eukprot:CAMPEP_0202113300 /NCGR_PEP_ID=MMETSP0965-20130614/33572_1 /ASSEMBLY_ACC=CAM_ASM_000507 /TAXON_ID=4773 /ORGANISM="Schizochytrium aggregatum, Strain ATCC28209" /LENGTH=50 /DNA_ID=CAMNT_0048682913 /DNA_START=11 /DNA_END=161 /DNA_ORIENTATION=-
MCALREATCQDPRNRAPEGEDDDEGVALLGRGHALPAPNKSQELGAVLRG